MLSAMTRLKSAYWRLSENRKTRRLERSYQRSFKTNVLEHRVKGDLILLASYPKSGNTWFRFIYANLILSLRGEPDRVVDYQTLDDLLPSDQLLSDLLTPWAFKEVPCLLKTHRPYSPIFSGIRAAFLYRNPLDTMVSAWNYFSRRAAPAPSAKSVDAAGQSFVRYKGSAAEFLSQHLAGWCRHYNSWISAADYCVSYEGLKLDPSGAYSSFLRAFRIEANEEALSTAIAKAEINRIKKLEKEKGLSTKMVRLDGEFARSGAIGQWKQHFSDADVRNAFQVMETNGISRERFIFD